MGHYPNAIYRRHSPSGCAMSALVVPATTFWVADGNLAFFFGPSGPTTTGTPTDTEPRMIIYNNNAPNALVERHLGTTNVLFCDGHVKAQKLDEFIKTKTMTLLASNTSTTGEIVPNFTIEDD